MTGSATSRSDSRHRTSSKSQHHPALLAARTERSGLEVPFVWPFQVTIVVTFLTSFVALPGPPVVRIVPTAFFLGLGLLLTPKDIIGRVRFDPAFVLLVVWCVTSLGWSIDRGQTVQQLFREFSRVLAVSVAVGVLGYERTRRTLGGLMQVAVVAAFVWWAAFPGTSSLPLSGDSETGLRVFFGHKNTLAKVALLAVLFFMSDKRLGRKRVLWVIAAGVLLRFTTATTALLAAVLGAAVFAIFIFSERLDRRGRTSLRVLTLFAGLMLVVASLASSVGSLINATGKDTTLTGRTEIWKITLPFARAEFAQGYGFGAVWEASTGPGPEINREVGDFPVVDAHNTYLEQVLQIGGVGTAIMAAWAASTVWRASKAMSRRPSDGAWIVSSVAALVLLGVSDAVFLGWLSWFALLSSASYQLVDASGGVAAATTPQLSDRSVSQRHRQQGRVRVSR